MNIKIIFFLVLFSSCSSGKVIRLKEVKDYSFNHFSPSKQIIPSPDDSAFAFINQVDSFMVSYSTFNIVQHYNDQLKLGKIDSFTSLLLTSNYNHKSCDLNLDAEARYFMGRKQNGDIILVADADNNNSFHEEKVHNYLKAANFSLSKNYEMMPVIKLENLQVCVNGKVALKSVDIKLKPDLPELSLATIIQITGKAFKGKFKLGHTKYDVIIIDHQNDFTIKNYKMFFNENVKDNPGSKFYFSKEYYKVGDTLVLNGQPLFISKLKTNFQKIILSKSIPDSNF